MGNSDMPEDRIVFFNNERTVYLKELLKNSPFEMSAEKKLIILIADQSIDCYISYFFLFYSIHVIIMIDEKIEVNDLDKLLEKYRPNYIVFPKAKNLSQRKARVIFECGTYLFTEHNENDLSIHKDLKFLLPTSGTTGEQKFVKLTQKNIETNTNDIVGYLGVSKEDIVPTTLPLSYSYGMSVVNSHIVAGAKIYVNSSSVIEKTFQSDLVNANVTNINGVPTFWEFAKRVGFIENFPSTLRYVTQAGGKLSNKIILDMYHACTMRDINFFVMYGQTECSPRMAYLNVNKFPDKIGSVGRPIDSGRFRFNARDKFDDKNSAELIYIGPNVGLGYSKSWKDLSDQDQWNGEIATGDIGKMDVDGFYYITGRIKRIHKISGVRIDLDICQMQVRNFIDWDNLFVIGKDEVLYLVSSAELNWKDLRNFISFSYSISPSKIKFICVNNLPITNGKISYYELEKMI